MTTDELKQIVADSMAFPDADFANDTPFREIAGYDSVNMLIMLVDLEDAGLHIPTEKAGQIQNFENIIAAAKEQGVLDHTP